jgi:hypothetical protein
VGERGSLRARYTGRKVWVPSASLPNRLRGFDSRHPLHLPSAPGLFWSPARLSAGVGVNACLGRFGKRLSAGCSTARPQAYHDCEHHGQHGIQRHLPYPSERAHPGPVSTAERGASQYRTYDSEHETTRHGREIEVDLAEGTKWDGRKARTSLSAFMNDKYLLLARRSIALDPRRRSARRSEHLGDAFCRCDRAPCGPAP